MSPDDRLPLRVCGRDGFRRYRAKSLRNLLGADVVGRDQRDKPVDASTSMCPVPNGCRCFGRISMSPVRSRQRPAKLGLSMTSRLAQSRGRPVARVEDHETSLAHQLSIRGGLENKRTKPVGSPTADHRSFDHASDVLDREDGLFA